MKEEVGITLNEFNKVLNDIFGKRYEITEHPNYFLDRKIAPVVDEIIGILESNKLSYRECYMALDFTHKCLKFKSEQVHL